MLDLRRLPVVYQKAVGTKLADILGKKNKKVYDKRVTAKADVILALSARLHTEGVPKLVVDNTTDSVIGGCYDTLVAIVRSLKDRVVALDDEQKAVRAAAIRLRDVAFPQGKRFLSTDMSVQYTAHRKLVTDLETPALAADVKTVGIEYLVRHIKVHLAPYGHAVMSPDGTSIEQISDAWHEAYEKFAIAVRDRYEDDPTMVAELLGPYQKELKAHVEAQRLARQRARKKKPEK